MTDPTELRLLIRQALQQVLAENSLESLPSPAKPATSSAAVIEPVDLSSEQAIHRFVCRILDMASDLDTARSIREGRIRFTTSAVTSPLTDSTASRLPGSSERIEAGAVTETHIRRLGDGITTLVLGRRAVLTPLGRERARMRGVAIIKESN